MFEQVMLNVSVHVGNSSSIIPPIPKLSLESLSFALHECVNFVSDQSHPY